MEELSDCSADIPEEHEDSEFKKLYEPQNYMESYHDSRKLSKSKDQAHMKS